MKGIITLLIFVCFFHNGVLAQKTAAKSVTEKNVKKNTAKKTAARKDESPQKKKESKSPPEKKKETAPEHEKKNVMAEPADSAKAAEIAVAQAADTVSATPSPQEAPAAISSAPATAPAPVLQPVDDWRWWIVWLSPVFIIGLAVYVFQTNGNIYKRLHRIQADLEAQKKDFTWEKAKLPTGITRAEVEHLINSNPALTRMMDECTTLKSNMEKLTQPSPKIVSSVPVEESIANTFYMTGPTNNYFPSSAKSSRRENTVYKFTLQPGGNEARFELHTTGASISEIIKVIESYIKPACDEENLPSSNIRNIVTRKQGVAILDNEKWIIKDKAVIRYE